MVPPVAFPVGALHLPDVDTEAVGNFRHKGLDLTLFPFRFKENPTVYQVPDKSAHLKFLCDLQSRVAESDPLHMAGIIDRGMKNLSIVHKTTQK